MARHDDEERGSSRRSRDDDREERGSSRSRDDDRGSRRSRDDDDRGSSRRGRDDDDGDSGYRYEARDPEKTRERGSKGAHDYDSIVKPGIKMFRPNDGDNRIRILPPTWKDPKPEHYGLDVYVHYAVGADRGSYLCLHKMLGKPDPVHEAREEARKELDGDEGNKDLEKYVKDLEAKRRVGIWLIDRDHEKEGPQFWAMPWTMDRDIIQVMSDKRTGEVLNIDDPEDGYDVEFVKKGAKDRTEYLGVAIARRKSELGDSKWMKYARENPIPDILNYYDYEHIAKAFGGKGAQRSSRDRDDDREDRNQRGRAGRDGDARGRGDDGRQRDRDRDGGRDRDDDRGSSRRKESDEPTWASVHEMTKSELVDLIDEQKLDIKPKEAKDTEDLADWVCEEMKLKKPAKDEERNSTRSRDSTDDDRPSRRKDDADEKFDDMRRRRERD